MLKHACLAMAALAITSPAVLAEKPGAGVGVIEVKGPTGGAVAQVVEIEAVVTAIDKKNRKVTVKGPRGRDVELAAGEEVRNFDQIKVGDMIKLKYYEAISLQLEKAPGAKPGITVVEEGKRAKPNDKPGAAVRSKVTVIGTVTAIDGNAQTVTVKGPRGNEVDIKVQDREKLKNVKIDDLVKATYTEALAISVSTPAKDDAKKK